MFLVHFATQGRNCCRIEYGSEVSKQVGRLESEEQCMRRMGKYGLLYFEPTYLDVFGFFKLVLGAGRPPDVLPPQAGTVEDALPNP